MIIDAYKKEGKNLKQDSQPILLDEESPAALSPAEEAAQPIDKKEYPLLPLRDVVVFPGMILPLFVGRPKSIAALEAAMQAEKRLVLTAQKRMEVDEPSPQDLYSIGTLINLLQLLKLPDGSIKVLVEGVRRVRINSILSTEPFLAIEAKAFGE
ncbi:MAG: LON peptidase substrate-binding domain-containing protein, partial [Candidatus Hinthialibacter sp.]